MWVACNTELCWPFITSISYGSTGGLARSLCKPCAERSLAQAQAKKATRKKPVARKAAAKPRGRTVVRRAGATPAKSKVDSTVAIGHLSRGVREILGLTMLAMSIVLVLALFSFNINDPGWSHTALHSRVSNAGGVAGAWFADVVFYLLGYMAFLVPAMIAFFGWVMFHESKPQNSVNAPFAVARLLGFAIMLPTACGLADLHFSVSPDSLPLGVDGGGLTGSLVAGKFVQLLNPLGATMIMLALFIGSFSLATRVSWLYVTEFVGGILLAGITGIAERLEGIFVSHATYREERLKQRSEQKLEREKQHQHLRVEKEARRAEKQKEVEYKRLERKKAKDLKVEQQKKAAADAVAAKAALQLKEPSIPVLEKAPLDKPAEPQSKPKPVKKVRATSQQPKDKSVKLFDPNGDSPLPPISMLDEPTEQSSGFSDDELESMSRLLEDRLAEFKVIAEVVAVQPGPVITRFELELAPGTKASKISGLSTDIARSMSLVSVRVVEVIPGKSTIGLEIPNDNREMVRLSEIIRSKKFEDSKSPLALALGKDIGGLPVVADLAKMPHLLVAGTTGSGKSVGVNSMLVSLLYKATPEEVRLILIDPKMLELSVYEDIPHLLAPVVTDMKEAANALRWSVGEMERRYKLMAALGVRNIAGYNKKVKQAIEDGDPIVDPLYKKEEAFDPEAPAPTLDTLPYIVIVVDEFADMIMVVGKKVEELIARIAQKARAAGIHLILATQRPSTDVITGLIKSNIPTRMAFQVSTKLDSRIVLDQGGAESLLGHGDMLYLPPGTAHALRVHGAFIDDHEVHHVVGYLKQQGTANYINAILEEPTVAIPGLTGETLGDDGGEKDALYDQAVAIVTETRKASISYVQRRLRIGYNRAARLVEEMEEAGVVSQVQSNGQREVIAPPPVNV